MMNVSTNNNISFQGVKADKIRKAIESAITVDYNPEEYNPKYPAAYKRRDGNYAATYQDLYSTHDYNKKQIKDLYKKCNRKENLENGFLGIGKTEKSARGNLIRNTINYFNKNGWPEIQQIAEHLNKF